MTRLPSFLRTLAVAAVWSLGLSLLGCYVPMGGQLLDSLTSSGPYPYSWYQRQKLPDGTSIRFGMWIDKAKYRMAIDHVTEDKIHDGDDHLIWRRTYGLLGEGAHTAFTAGAVLPNGTILAAAGEQLQTRLAFFGFEPDGRPRWAREIDLPTKIGSKARLIPTGDGAVILAPLSTLANHQPTSTFLLRVDERGEILWTTTLTIATEPIETLWSPAGLTVAGNGEKQRGFLLWRVDPTGALAFMEDIAAPLPRRFETVKASVEGAGVVVHTTSGGCPACGFTDTLDLRFDPTGALQSIRGEHGKESDEPRKNNLPPPARDPKNPEITVSTVQIAPLQPSVGHPTTPTRDLGAELARTEKLERKEK